MLLERILDGHPVTSLEQYVANGGGLALDAARRVEREAVIDTITASGLRGRGGAGFPTGIKWRTVVENSSVTEPTTVVVNAAEGEPGTFKDRMLLRTNPYKVLEGALVAAHAVGAVSVVVGIKGSFEREITALARAIEEIEGAGFGGDVRIRILPGPGEYLFGEETALLEVLEGRQPFPRVVPPFRRGIDDTDHEVGPTSSSTEMATPDSGGGAPTLANNVETFANVPGIIVEGPEAFRRLGTPDSPGTIVCTVTGRTARHGVGEVEMGTRLRDVIELIGGGAAPERTLTGAISGSANRLVPAELFDTPLTHEAMNEIGSGLGAAGFIVVDDSCDMVAVAHGISRFLAVESCGQCEPCKSDGLALAERLDALRRSETGGGELDEIAARLGTVADNARCSLASQQEQVVGSILERFPDTFRAHLDGTLGGAAFELTAPIVDIRDGWAVLDDSQSTKQPDWSHDATPSEVWPAAGLADTPVSVRIPSLVDLPDGTVEDRA